MSTNTLDPRFIEAVKAGKIEGVSESCGRLSFPCVHEAIDYSGNPDRGHPTIIVIGGFCAHLRRFW